MTDLGVAGLRPRGPRPTHKKGLTSVRLPGVLLIAFGIAMFAEKYAVERVLDGYQAVIDDAEVDVVYNALANSQHAPWNLAAIAAGKIQNTPLRTSSERGFDLASSQSVSEGGLEPPRPLIGH